jgi:23S rRNA pseudouridine2605 synthase
LRLQKFMAKSGLGSRRACEEIIKQGRVEVNGKIINKMGMSVNPEKDRIKVDGELIQISTEKIYILMNKPTGVITTVNDPFNRPTVIDMLKSVKERVFPVGRLDKDTEGLLILTNDGSLTYKITHPKYEIQKTYVAHLSGRVNKDKLMILQNGVKLEDGITAPANIKVLLVKNDYTILQIKIHEGRNRQIRRMCKAIGHPLLYLKRTRIGNIDLQDLNVGEWRYMTKQEINYLKNL